MSQNLSFNIKIPDGHMVQFDQEATFENFIGQFQPYCPKLLCVVDGTILHYYDKTGGLPTNIRFDYKQRRGLLTEYYFRNIGNDTLYCVFGREAATIFYPRIDEVDPTGIHELSNITPHSIPQISDIPLPIENLQVSSNINPTLNTEAKHQYRLRDSSNPDLISSLRSNKVRSEVESNIHHQDPILLSGSTIDPNKISNKITSVAGVNNNLSNTDHRKTLPLTQHIPSDICKPKRPLIIQPIKPQNSSIPLYRETPNNINIATRVISNQSSIPDQIIIIDKGIKLTFPNPNYPIEVKTYYPS
jgi:hypothetical protein